MTDMQGFIQEYGSREELLSTLYDFWAMTDKTGECLPVGNATFDVNSNAVISLFVCDGITKEDFCSVFFNASIRTIEFAQRYKNSHDPFYCIAMPRHANLCISNFAEEDYPILKELQERMHTPTPVPDFPTNCYDIQQYRQRHAPEMSKEKMLYVLLQALKNTPSLRHTIMVSGKEAKYKSYTGNEKEIHWVYAHNKDTRQLVVYDANDDTFVSANFDFRPKG